MLAKFIYDGCFQPNHKDYNQVTENEELIAVPTF